MNVSFCQTYGDRLPLLKIRVEDSRFLRFVNNFDINILSLHNVSDNVKEFIKTLTGIKNLVIFNLEGLSYGQCIQHFMKFLEKEKVNKFFFYQDDTFSCEIRENNENDLKDMIFNMEYDIINLSYKLSHLLEQNKWTEKEKTIIHSTSSFNLYNTDTSDFKESGLWSFDDSCYVSSFERLKEIYDESYFSYKDVWQAEHYLKNKFDKKIMNRYITDTSFFINYNILGRNTILKNIEYLKSNISLTENSLKLLEKYIKDK